MKPNKKENLTLILLKKNIENDKKNNNDIVNLDDYGRGRLLIDDNEEGEKK